MENIDDIIEYCNKKLSRVKPGHPGVTFGYYDIHGSYFSGEVYTFHYGKDGYIVFHKTKIPTMNLRFRNYLMYREIEKHMVKLIEEQKIQIPNEVKNKAIKCSTPESNSSE